MNPNTRTPANTLQIGPDVFVMADVGEVWSLATDNPQFELRMKDWDHFNAADCKPADFQVLVHQLQKSA